MTIEGKPFLVIQPEFTTPPRVMGQRQTEMVTFGQSPALLTYTGKHAMHSLNHAFFFQSRADIQAFADFFDGIAGKWGAFFMPSWLPELNPVAGIADGGSELSISPMDYYAAFLADSETTRLGHYIFLLNVDGTMHVSKVIESTTVEDTEVLTLETPVPQAFALGEFMAGFVYFVRFAQDTLTIEFSGATKGRSNVGVIEVVKIGGYSDYVPAVPDVPPADYVTDSLGEKFTDPTGDRFTY